MRVKIFSSWDVLRHLLLLALCAAALAGCASAGKGNKLNDVQYAYSAAIRWGDFEGAWNLVDPAFREAHPMSDLQFERYKQVQVSGYRDLATQAGADGSVMRDIQVDVINKHDMSERSVRYTEHWVFDAKAGAWWQTTGLPDFWKGE